MVDYVETIEHKLQQRIAAEEAYGEIKDSVIAGYKASLVETIKLLEASMELNDELMQALSESIEEDGRIMSLLDGSNLH